MPSVHSSKIKQPKADKDLTGFEKNTVEDISVIEKRLRSVTKKEMQPKEDAFFEYQELKQENEKIKSKLQTLEATMDGYVDKLNAIGSTSVLEARLDGCADKLKQTSSAVESVVNTVESFDVQALLRDARKELAEIKSDITSEITAIVADGKAKQAASEAELDRFKDVEQELRQTIVAFNLEKQQIETTLESFIKIKAELDLNFRVDSTTYQTIKKGLFGLVQDMKDEAYTYDFKSAMLVRMNEQIVEGIDET